MLLMAEAEAVRYKHKRVTCQNRCVQDASWPTRPMLYFLLPIGVLPGHMANQERLHFLASSEISITQCLSSEQWV